MENPIPYTVENGSAVNSDDLCYTDKFKEGVFFHHRDLGESQSLRSSHCHGFYEALYIFDGDGKYLIEGNEYDLRPGSLFIAAPLDYHCVEVTPGVPYNRAGFYFRLSSLPPSAQKILNERHGLHSSRGLYFSPEEGQTVFGSIFEKMCRAEAMPKDLSRDYLLTLLTESIYAIENLKEQEEDSGNDLGSRIIRYLNDHVTEHISLDSLAEEFYASKYYLCRAFKKKNGISIHEYLTQKRIHLAKAMIERGENASSAAYRVGFGDYSCFYRAFVKVIGRSPINGQDEDGKE